MPRHYDSAVMGRRLAADHGAAPDGACTARFGPRQGQRLGKVRARPSTRGERARLDDVKSQGLGDVRPNPARPVHTDGEPSGAGSGRNLGRGAEGAVAPGGAVHRSLSGTVCEGWWPVVLH
jgi:hypothetical protein